ncbi:MAG: hypothetical protein ACLTZT_14150 [Butyricimonas faecalis]
MSLTGIIVQKDDFNYRMNLTYSYNTNEVISSPYEMSPSFILVGW